jgi:short-subunit dehydrogenase
MKKTALITGASSGIGLEFARIFAREGYNLVLVARSKNKLEALAAEIHAKYTLDILVVDADLSQADSGQSLFDLLQQKNISVHTLINNAGFGDHGFFPETNLEKIVGMIDLNMRSLTILTRLFLEPMIREKSGQILNVSSTAAFQPGPFMAVYYASKAYVESFTEAIAHELKGTGVHAMSLCPGPTTSGFMETANMEGSNLGKMAKLADSSSVAEYGYRKLKQGKRIAIHGALNRFGVFLTRLFPRCIAAAAAAKANKKS